MFVRAVAGVDDGDIEDARDVECGASGGVAEDDHVGLEGLDVLGGVAEGFALGRAGGGGVEGDHVGAQKFSRHLERHAGAGAGLEKKINDIKTRDGVTANVDSLEALLKSYVAFFKEATDRDEAAQKLKP